MGWKSTCEISISGEGQEEMRSNGKYLSNNFSNSSNHVDNNGNNNSFNMASWFSCHKNQHQMSQLELQPPLPNLSDSSEHYHPHTTDSIKQLYQPANIPTGGNLEFSHMIDSSRRHDLIYDIQTPSRTLPSQQLHQLYYHHHPSHNQQEQLKRSTNQDTDPSRPIAKPVFLYVTSDKQHEQTDIVGETPDQNISIVSKFPDVQCECRDISNKDVHCRCFDANPCQSYLKSN